MKARPVSNKEKKQLLLSVLGSLDGRMNDGWYAALKRELGFLAGAFMVVLIMLITRDTDQKITLLVAALGSVAGFVVAMSAYRIQSARLWQTVAQCIDRSIVEAKLRELDA